MRSRSRRIAVGASLVGLGGYLFSGPGSGCGSFAAESTLFAANFCFIFDCQSGILGGTILPCSESELREPLFTDCERIGGP